MIFSVCGFTNFLLVNLCRPDQFFLCVILLSHVGSSDHGISIIVDRQVRFSPPKSTMRPLIPAAFYATTNVVAHFTTSIAPGVTEVEELSPPHFSEWQDRNKAKSRRNKQKVMDLCTKDMYLWTVQVESLCQNFVGKFKGLLKGMLCHTWNIQTLSIVCASMFCSLERLR